MSWKVGENQPIPFAQGDWRHYSAEELKASGGAYSLLISTVVPRPIALVSSISSAGVVNCAPYSYFNAVCHDPPLIVIGMNLNSRSGTKKDTLNNVEQTRKKRNLPHSTKQYS
jgi:flavin reductase (DIM6/NTAB) family NADH-FMN oxidoreductase RutF